MSTQPSVPDARDVVRQVAPKLIDLSETVLFGDIYAGWPAAMTAGTIARRVFDARKP